MNEQRVVCAACRCHETGKLFLGARHYDETMKRQIEDVWGSLNHILYEPLDEGFVDQFGNFLTREEAHVIAVKQNQIIRRCGGDETRLYSENLY